MQKKKKKHSISIHIKCDTQFAAWLFLRSPFHSLHKIWRSEQQLLIYSWLLDLQRYCISYAIEKQPLRFTHATWKDFKEVHRHASFIHALDHVNRCFLKQRIFMHNLGIYLYFEMNHKMAYERCIIIKISFLYKSPCAN